MADLVIDVALVLAGLIALLLIGFPTPVKAQGGPTPFPGNLIAEGVWPDPLADRDLIGLPGNKIIEWQRATGQYRLWQLDPTRLGGGSPFLEQPLAEGVLGNPGDRLVRLGGANLLVWQPASGRYQVQRYALTADNQLSSQAIVQGTLPAIDEGHQLIALSGGTVLDWQPVSGDYRLWRYDPTLTDTVNGFPGELLAAGNWPTIRSGHTLVYLGNHRLLDWEAAGGQIRIWHYDPLARGSTNPLGESPLIEGLELNLDEGSHLLSLGQQRLMAWNPVSGQYRIWQYTLTAVAAFSLEDIAERLAGQTISGVTVVTHGRQLFDSDGDSMISLAEAIHQKAGGWLLDYDLPDDTEDGFFDTCTNDCNLPATGDLGTTELVLLFDWAAESNEFSSGWGEAAGDALFSMLIGLGVIDPTGATNPPLHFIAHSFGTAVNSETVERLAYFDVPVDHVTYLDPHDFDQNLLGAEAAQRLFELGLPPGYGASVWTNVAFADVYYQTRGQSSLSVLVPNGRPIPGAYNRLVLAELPASYPSGDFSGDHSFVWNCFYLGSVIGSLPMDCQTPQQTIPFTQTGYAFSHLVNGAARPDANFYDSQDHFYSETNLVDPQSGLPNDAGLAELGLTAEQVIQGRWSPDWIPLNIVNGDFEHYNNTDYQPGWSHHGGGGSGIFNQADSNAYLELNVGNTIHSHNRFYLPSTATHLRFDLRREDGPLFGSDTFEVQLGGQTLASYELREDDAFEDADFVTRTLPIPELLRSQVVTLTFQLLDTQFLDGSTAWVDNVTLFGEDRPLYFVHLPLIYKP